MFKNRFIFLLVSFNLSALFYGHIRFNSSNVPRLIKSLDYFRPDLMFDSRGTYPYISGANLVLLADFVYDNKVKTAKKYNQFNDYDIIFVKTDFITIFFNRIFPKITRKIILITHNSDYSARKQFLKYLNDKKLIAWFAQNPGFIHEKLIGIPIGFGNPIWFGPKGNVFLNKKLELIDWNKRKHLIYINIDVSTNDARKHLVDLFRDFNNVLIPDKQVSYVEFMNNIGNSKYVLCPSGNGFDTHRVYETILMGSIPIVLDSTLNSLYRESTILVVDDFASISEYMLNNPNLFIRNMNFTQHLLMMDYWSNRINSLRK